jgi:L-fuconolactonase
MAVHAAEGQSRMLIVDSQVHIWGEDTPERPWPAPAHGRPVVHREQPITALSLLAYMKEAGVDRAIVVPPSWEGDRNDLVAKAVTDYPDRFRYVARYSLADPSLPQWIENWRDNAGMLALQLTFQTPLFQRPLVEGEIEWLWSAAERAGLPLTIYAPNALMPKLDQVAREHSALNIVINHFGLTGTRRDEEAFSDFDNLLALSARPNVALKASCLPFYTTQAYPFANLHRHIKSAFDAFGPRRLFWGTDLSRLPCSYREGVTLFTEQLPWLQGDDRTWVMGRGICEWLSWDDRAP